MSIRNRTAYSFRSAIGALEPSHKKITEITGGFSVITDTASCFAHTRWSKLCSKVGSKPVFGIELAVTDSIAAKKPGYDHWTFIAENDLRAIHDLLKLATQQFRYVPLLTYDQANRAEGVFAIAGSKSNLDLIRDNTFIALSPSLTRAQYKKAMEKGLPFVSSSDNRFLNEENRDLFAVQLGRDASNQTYAQHLLTNEEWNDVMSWVPEDVRVVASGNTKHILSCSVAQQRKGTLLSPPKPKTLEKMCREGAKRIGCNLKKPGYEARMKRELELIYSKKFEDYFYIIADVCQWARKRMIVGPARGSSCGSLVCYLLEITTVDPIEHGLIFERFIDVNRDDLPDIDIDFSDVKRQMVFDYMGEKYGQDHIARLGTVAIYRPRSALQAAAVAFDIPRWRVDKVSDSIIERSGGDARALQTTEDTLRETPVGREFISEYPEMLISAKMEGQPTHHSQHAAGIVLTEGPITDYVGIDSRTGATHCDKKDAEDLGLLKIDALGLTQLSIFEDILEMINKPYTFINTIPLDDRAAFDVLNNRKYAGIFQFNGVALQSITDQIKDGLSSFNDIVSITALARPGPLNTGSADKWTKVKNGVAPLTVPHPSFLPYLEDTLGVVTYQEQVMNIGREIGDLSWGDVTALRKAMSKSLGKEFFDKYGDKWKEGARKRGIPEEVLNKVWDDLCAYGSWAFNKSHAVAYGLISYYCCWFKAHYPVEFAAATLTHTDSVESQIALLRELNAEGVGYVPVDPEQSLAKWAPGVRDGKKVVVGPLSLVIGIGPKSVGQILSARARGEPLTGKAAKLLQDPKTPLDSLWPIRKRIEEIMPDPRERNINTPPTRIVNCQVNGRDQEVMVFCVIRDIKPKDDNEEMAVAKRGYKVKGKSQALNLWLADDTDKIFARVDRFDFDIIGQPIVDRGRAGKSLYAIKGQIPPDFRMIRVKQIRYIGDMEQ